MALLSRDGDQDKTGTPAESVTDALRDLPPDGALFPGNEEMDPEHDYVIVELLSPEGKVLAHTRWDAPANANAQRPLYLRTTVTHPDGCSRTLNTSPVPNY